MIKPLLLCAIKLVFVSSLRLDVLSGSLSLLCAIKFVFASLLRLDVTDRLEPEKREIFSSALLISEKCSDVSGFLFKSF